MNYIKFGVVCRQNNNIAKITVWQLSIKFKCLKFIIFEIKYSTV